MQLDISIITHSDSQIKKQSLKIRKKEGIQMLIKNIISEELASSEDGVNKLKKLNENSVLNSYLANKQYNEIIQTVVQIIEDGTQTTNNIDVLKFYLHELGLIFNINISQHYLPGVA